MVSDTIEPSVTAVISGALIGSACLMVTRTASSVVPSSHLTSVLSLREIFPLAPLSISTYVGVSLVLSSDVSFVFFDLRVVLELVLEEREKRAQRACGRNLLEKSGLCEKFSPKSPVLMAGLNADAKYSAFKCDVYIKCFSASAHSAWRHISTSHHVQSCSALGLIAGCAKIFQDPKQISI